MEYTLKALRQELKNAGYKLTIKTYSEFKAGTITDIGTGKSLSQIMSKEDFEFFKPALDIREKYKGKIFDGLYRVVI